MPDNSFTIAQSEVSFLPEDQRENISDGYHTFKELYDHRIALFIALCNWASDWAYNPCWKSKKHHDGTMHEGWFIAGIHEKPGEQISYHLPLSYWDKLKDSYELEEAPEWDGHTPADVVKRLMELA